MIDKELPEPKALAFIICDTVIDDKITNKKSLIGLFNSIATNKFPFIQPIIHVFVSLTEGYGEYQCSLSCAKDEGKNILQLSGPLKFEGPLAVVEAHFNIRGATFPEAGIYRFEFSCNNIPIISRKFEVVERRPP